MEIIEFLEKTQQKNIKSFIAIKVKEKVLEYEAALQERQKILRDILELENMKYEEELVQLMNEKLNEQYQKRLDWINTKCMERRKAEEELLKLKGQQRQLENCEEWRHFQSKQLLLDSKRGQLYQIEDKRLRAQREKYIDGMWHEVMKRLNCEKEHQEIYKNKLLKVIEKENQLKNQKSHDNNKKRKDLMSQQDKKKFHEENQMALFIEENHRKDEKLKKFLSNTRHNQVLKTQIASNAEKKTLEAQLLSNEARSQKVLEDQNFLSELEQAEREKTLNNEWQKYYLENSLKEKQQKIYEQNEFERMYLNTGCVLQQRPRQPYGKNTR